MKLGPDETVALLSKAGRPMTAGELSAHGAHRLTLHRLAKAGRIERGARGVYLLPESGMDERTQWAVVAKAVPEAVFCMQSAAAYHGLTQNLAPELNVAVPYSRSLPPSDMGVVRAVWTKWSSADSFVKGVMTAEISGVEVKLTDPERTIVDLYRYSSLHPQRSEPRVFVDTETVHDALARYLHSFEGGSPGKLRRMAIEFGVWKRMEPIATLISMGVGPNLGM